MALSQALRAWPFAAGGPFGPSPFSGFGFSDGGFLGIFNLKAENPGFSPYASLGDLLQESSFEQWW